MQTVHILHIVPTCTFALKNTKLIKCRHKNQVISIIDVDYFYDKFVLYLKISNCVPDTAM